MKQVLVILLFFNLLLIACQKDNNPELRLHSGRYTGTFNRTGMDTATVFLEFNLNRFSGQSSLRNYPALCGGYYYINNNIIEFSDTCAWTADFDWSLILQGNFQLSTNSDESIRIWKSDNGITDEYLLRRVNL